SLIAQIQTSYRSIGCMDSTPPIVVQGPGQTSDASSEALSGQPAAAAKPSYPPPAPIPTQVGHEGIRFDFTYGARVLPPERSVGSWRVRLRDLDTGNVLFESENKGALVSSTKRWFVRFGVEVWSLDQGEAGDVRPVLRHDLDLHGREVL